MSSPYTDWTYYDDTRILFAVDVNTEDILWYSDKSGYLGSGNHLHAFLPEGAHTITVDMQNSRKERVIYVHSRAPSDSRKTLITYLPFETQVLSGTYYPSLFTLSGSISGVSIAPKATNPTSIPPVRNSSNAGSAQEPLRDPRVVSPHIGAIVHKPQYRTAAPTLVIGSKRTFFVINTSAQYMQPHELEAELLYCSDLLAVWIPAVHTTPTALATDALSATQIAALSTCIQAVETRIVPRVTALWGMPVDINEDGRLSILVSPTLNAEAVAVGFFNPADFFKRNTDSSSSAYNPASNEMDIIYVAVPDSQSGSSYSPDSIIATIAHELTHASTFSEKTWKRLTSGNADALREELFLDEGWSHLTENLCGYGVSGGNIKFLRRYLDDTATYSFCEANRYGQDDSAGMRGAMTLFLSWLFWRQGGMTWDNADPTRLVDSGGIAFLRRMLASSTTGWESIGQAYGEATDTLFQAMLAEINQACMCGSVYHFKPDPISGEPLDCFPNMGSGENHVGFPKAYPLSEAQSLLPWSYMLFEPYEKDSALVINARTFSGTVYYMPNTLQL
jgi:hypothetical protein